MLWQHLECTGVLDDEKDEDWSFVPKNIIYDHINLTSQKYRNL